MERTYFALLPIDLRRELAALLDAHAGALFAAWMSPQTERLAATVHCDVCQLPARPLGTPPAEYRYAWRAAVWLLRG